ncbi:MAG: 6,7-dimethyl-8-ribityllumazine synthase [Pseudomonadota bacterium]
MVRHIEGALTGSGFKIAVITTRWNDFVVDKLTDGAVSTLRRHGVSDDAIDIVTVPGAYEVPFTARMLAKAGRYDAIVALGAVIRGSTPHFDYVAGEAATGLAKVGHDSGVPVAFGVLTVDTIEQAIERAGTKAGNKGAEAASVALEMANLTRTLTEA